MGTAWVQDTYEGYEASVRHLQGYEKGMGHLQRGMKWVQDTYMEYEGGLTPTRVQDGYETPTRGIRWV